MKLTLICPPTKLFYAFFFICFTSFSQDNQLQDTLISMSTHQEKLDYLSTIIPTQLYANPEKVMHYAEMYDSIAQYEQTLENKANAFNFKGMAYYVNEKPDPAIENYLQAIRILEKSDSEQKLSRVYNNLAACYNIRKDFENTEKYFLKSLELSENLKDKPWVANINNNLAVLYMQNKQYAKANTASENALSYYKSTNDSLMMGITYMNYGNSKLFSENLKDAMAYYTKSLTLIQLKQVPIVHAVSNSGIGIVLTKQKKYTKALSYLTEGIDIAKNIGNTEQLMEGYNALADYYSLTKNYKGAYELSLESQKLKDSVLSKEQDQNIIEALTKYETEKKDTELKLLKAENENKDKQKQLYLILAISGLAIASLFGFFANRNNKQKRILAKQKDQLEVTIEEKNVLFKEIHHRVKNSLQMVSSLLFLQGQNISDKEAKNAIKDAQNRVRSLGLIHQKLYSKKHIIGVETKDYISDLIQDIFNSHQLESQNLEYDLDIENIVLNVDTLTPIGLILNELIVNVLKHAFKQDEAGNKLDIQFYKEEDTLVLKVIDNGIGFNEDTVRENSFGLKLINSLARKLDATFTIQSKEPKGTETVLIINDFEIIKEK